MPPDLDDLFQLGLGRHSSDNPILILDAILDRQLKCVDLDAAMEFAVAVANQSLDLIDRVYALPGTTKRILSRIFVRVLRNLPYDLIEEFLSPYNFVVAFMVEQIADECQQSHPVYIPFFINLVYLHLDIYASEGSEKLLDKFLLPNQITALARSLAVHVIDKAVEIKSEPRLSLAEFNAAFKPQKCSQCTETNDCGHLPCGHILCRKCLGRRAVMRDCTCPVCEKRLC